MSHGDPRSVGLGSDNFLLSESAVGRIMHERFLIERDITDPSAAGGQSAFVVKDLRDRCRRVVFKTLTASDEGAASFRRVHDILRELDHPNAERVTEAGRLSDGRMYLVAEHSPGRTLDEIVAGGKRLRLRDVARVLEPIANVLKAAHAKGVLHCDARPRNVLVLDGGRGVRLMNFGYGWPVDVRGEGLVNVVPGGEPLHYAAPELLIKLGHRGPASDVYSLAAVAYRMIVGSAPFPGETVNDVLFAIDSARPTWLNDIRTDISRELEKLLLAGLEFEPAARPRDIGDYADRLVRAMHPPEGLDLISASPDRKAVVPIPVFEPRRQPPRVKEEASPPPSRLIPVFSDRAVAWVLIILLMGAALSIPAGQILLKQGTEAASTNPPAPKPAEALKHPQIRYKLEFPAVPNRFGRASDGRTGGWRLTCISDTPGEMYLFGETAGPDGRQLYTLLHPATDITAESPARIEAGKPVIVASRNGQPEKTLWLAFTTSPSKDLEAIRSSAAEDAVLNENDAKRLRHFLERGKSVRVDAFRDAAAGETVLEAWGDRVVSRINPGGE